MEVRTKIYARNGHEMMKRHYMHALAWLSSGRTMLCSFGQKRDHLIVVFSLLSRASRYMPSVFLVNIAIKTTTRAIIRSVDIATNNHLQFGHPTDCPVLLPPRR